MDDGLRKFRTHCLDLGQVLRNAYAHCALGTAMSVQDHVRGMYSEFDKVGLFQPQSEVPNLDFVRFGILQSVYAIVPEAVTTMQCERRFEWTVWTLQGIIRRFASTAYSPNGEALLKSDFDAFRQSAFLLKRFASGEGFYSSVMRLTFSVTGFVAPKSCFSCRLLESTAAILHHCSPLSIKTHRYNKCFFSLPYVQFLGSRLKFFRWRNWLTLCSDWRTS